MFTKAEIVDFCQRLVRRHQDKIPLSICVRSGFKGFITLTIMSFMSFYSEIPLVIASFGASCILIYTTPEDEFSQPANIVGSYFVVGVIGIYLTQVLPHEWWTLGLICGACISGMAVLRVTHPPAGSLPVILYFSEPSVGFDFLLFPILSGSVLLVVIALVLHTIMHRRYPTD